MDFLVLYKFGPEPLDYRFCAIVRDKKAEEGEAAIEESMTEGPGVYVAIPLSKAVFLKAETKVEFTPSDGTVEATPVVNDPEVPIPRDAEPPSA